ncbi:MAG: phosphate ABC transporter substrate-binding protein [Thermodesulfobacteriota bacterium]|nr:phosphate ABC transporter substrate-binding protein [Thermodesulfobacteriota bacterium]
MKFKLIVSLIVAFIFTFTGGYLAATGVLDIFSGQKGTIRIAGGTAHIPVMKEAAMRIMKINPDIKITVAGGGSGVGVKQVGEGLVDIGNTGRKATADEIRRYGLVLHKFAVDGIAVIVNPKNHVIQLTKKQIEDIFAGNVKKWSDLGWKDRSINVYTRDASSGTRKVFWKKALNKGEITQKANFVKSNGAMKSAISVDPYGIGYVSIGHLDNTVVAAAIDGISPTLESVQDGKYTIARGLYMNTKGHPSGLTKHFIDYILSKEGQQIVNAKGFMAVR